MAITFGSLFTGIGGLDLGLERAGLECRWQCEIDPFCRLVLSRHWPDLYCHADVSAIRGEQLEWVNGIVAGFPCQDVSVAGKQNGIDGARSGLFRQALRLFCEVRPDWLLLENVPGLLTGGLGTVLGSLAENGLDAEWDCYGTADFGAPAVRERIFILAYAPSYRLERDFDHLLQRPDRGALETLDAWHASSSPFREWRKLLAESRVIRVPGGFAQRVDRPKQRLKAIGNCVSPQVAEWIGRCISMNQ